jgi:AraC family transcriptional regulator of adaptative response / DNA-3-methyladenine glycosylase II
MSRVADASGFQSVRRFNSLFRERYRLNPEALRRRIRSEGARPPNVAKRVSAREGEPREPNLRLTLAYRPPLAWRPLLAFLSCRATPGVERVSSGTWARTVRIDGRTGVIRVREPDKGSVAAGHDAVLLEADASLAPALMPLCAKVKHLFDLVAEPNAIEAHLARAGFGPIAKANRGLRVPGAWDGFELAVRAILAAGVGGRAALWVASPALGDRLAGGDEGSAPDADSRQLANAGTDAIRRIGYRLRRRNDP